MRTAKKILISLLTIDAYNLNHSSIQQHPAVMFMTPSTPLTWVHHPWTTWHKVQEHLCYHQVLPWNSYYMQHLPASQHSPVLSKTFARATTVQPSFHICTLKYSCATIINATYHLVLLLPALQTTVWTSSPINTILLTCLLYVHFHMYCIYPIFFTHPWHECNCTLCSPVYCATVSSFH